MIVSKNIPIPARPGAAATTLHVKIVAESEACLKTRNYLFMLPGGPGANHSHYQDYECLQDSANIVFYDPRGCGLSAKGAPNSYTMANYIQDLEIIRQELGLDSLQLLGKSYGAMCALGYTLRYPHVVTHLVVAAGSPSFRNLDSAKKHVDLHANDAQKAVCRTLFNGSFQDQAEMDHFFEVMATYYSYKKRNHLPTARPKAVYPFAFEALNLGFSDFLRHFDYEPLLPNIRCKTLVLVGEEDWITAKEHAITIADHIPDAQLIIFEKANHALEHDVPELFFKKIGGFIQDSR